MGDPPSLGPASRPPRGSSCTRCRCSCFWRLRWSRGLVKASCGGKAREGRDEEDGLMPRRKDCTLRRALRGEGVSTWRGVASREGLPLSILSDRLLNISPPDSSRNTESDPMDRLSRSGESKERWEAMRPRTGSGSRPSSEFSDTLRTEPQGEMLGVGWITLMSMVCTHSAVAWSLSQSMPPSCSSGLLPRGPRPGTPSRAMGVISPLRSCSDDPAL